MAQKINPMSFRLGLSQLWNSSQQKYGKNLFSYIKMLHNRFQVLQYIKSYSKEQNIIISIPESIIKKQKVVINLTYFSKNYDIIKILLQLQQDLSKTFPFWSKSPALVNIYKQSYWPSSADLLIGYIAFSLINDQQTKRLLVNIQKILSYFLLKEKIIYSSTGIIRVQLKGLKFMICGCFSTSAVQLSKSVSHNVGFLRLSELNNYVEYSYRKIYTKYGTCGLKVWFVYENINNNEKW